MPSARWVHRERHRIITGLELMKLVGFREDLLKLYAQSVDDKHIAVDPYFSDLAGNAWSGPVILSLCVAVLVRLTPKHLGAFKAGSSSTAAVRDSDDDAFDSIMSM